MEEESLRRSVPAGDLNQARPCHGGELTRTNSVSSSSSTSSSSSLTVQSSKESLSQTVKAEKPGQITEWTDEKHDSYLNFLEATFVKELNHSMHKCQWHPGKLGWGPYSAHHLSKNVCNSFNQFTVLQDGHRQKIKFDRDEHLVNRTAHSNIHIESPWIDHFASAGKHCSMTNNAKEHGLSSSQSTHLQEVTDQNFLEEDLNAKSNGVHLAKRLRKADADNSCTDQVVPSGQCHTTNVSKSNTASVMRKESQKENLLSELPEDSVYKKSDMHYFLGGS